MRRKRKTEITVEFEEVFVIRRPRRSIMAWCAECADQVRMVAPDEAATAASVSSRTIYRWVEARRIHFTETPEGFLLICHNSLS